MARQHDAIDVFPHTPKALPVGAPIVPKAPTSQPKILSKPARAPEPPSLPIDEAGRERLLNVITTDMTVVEVTTRAQHPMDAVLDALELLAQQKRVRVYRPLGTGDLTVVRL